MSTKQDTAAAPLLLHNKCHCHHRHPLHHFLMALEAEECYWPEQRVFARLAGVQAHVICGCHHNLSTRHCSPVSGLEYRSACQTFTVDLSAGLGLHKSPRQTQTRDGSPMHVARKRTDGARACGIISWFVILS